MSGRGVLAANNLFALAAKLLEGGKSVVVALLVIQFFSPEEFGVYSVAIAVGSVVAVVAEFRLMGILVRLFSQYPRLVQRLLVNAMTLNVLFAIIGIALTALSYWFVDDLLYQCLMLFSLSYLFKFGRCIRGVLVAERQNNYVAYIETFSGVVVLSAIGLALWAEASILTVILIRALDFLLVSVLYILLIKYKTSLPKGAVRVDATVVSPSNSLRSSPIISTRLMGFLIKKSFPLVLSGAAMLLFQRVDLILIQALLSSSQAGIYAAATAVVSVFGIVALVLSESLAPRLFKDKLSDEKQLATNEPDQLSADRQFGQVLLVLGGAMSVLSFVVAPQIIEWFFAPVYAPAIEVARVLSLTPFAISLGAFAGQIIIKQRLEQGVFVKSVVACVITIGLNLCWIPVFGIEGAAWATVLGLFVANYLSHRFIGRLKPIFELQNQVVRELLSQLVPRMKKVVSR